MLSFLIYFQCLILTGLYCFLSSFFFVWASIFRFSRLPAYLRLFILYYGKMIVRFGCFPWVRVSFDDFARNERPVGIYVLNHRSASDPFLVSVVFNRCQAVQAVNRWPMRLPFFGFFARKAGYLDVLALDYETCLDKCRKLLGQGVSIAVFPEGTRSGSSRMNQFHSLFFRIACDLKIPMIPVAVSGNERIPDRSFKMHSGVIRIHKLPMILPDGNPILMKKKVRTVLLEETARMDSLV